jgi:hypothetical protein
MKLHRILSLVLLPTFISAAAGADLSQIKRSLVKEPVYHSQPKYCLLVFGPEAKTRVWLVQDGDVLYVDRNGNGGLTEPSKKVHAETQDKDQASYSFRVGDIAEGSRRHKDLMVAVAKIDYLADSEPSVKSLLAKNANARGYTITCEVEMPGWKGAGVGGRVQQRALFQDVNGVLQFADKPQDAPVVHFGGPWQIAFFSRQQLMLGRETDVVLGVGTPGIGAGSTAWIDYEGVVPEGVFPTLDVTYAPKRPGESPICEHYELKRRC